MYTVLPGTSPLIEAKPLHAQLPGTCVSSPGVPVYTAKLIWLALTEFMITERLPDAGTPTLYHTSKPAKLPFAVPQPGSVLQPVGRPEDCVANVVVPFVSVQTTGA